MSEGTWIYHERQEALLCGQHALNNLVQECAFSPDMLSEIAQQLDEMEFTYMAANNEGGIYSKDYLRRVAEGSGNVDPSGNFSIEVLRAALENRYSLSLLNIRQEGIRDTVEVTNLEGFICNKQSHWFAIRKIGERFWNLNSTLNKPELISHFRLAAEIYQFQEDGYSVFCVEGGLPAPCTSESDKRERGLSQYWWKEVELLRGKGTDASTTNATDRWSNVGSGMRLDGKSTTKKNNQTSLDHCDSLTEEDMMQLALQASMQTITTATVENHHNDDNDNVSPTILPEPTPGEKGAVRIQFRLPDGSRFVRRFRETEPISSLYAFAKKCCPSPNKNIEIRAGFPPKDLASFVKETTIQEAKLSGESVQCRYL